MKAAVMRANNAPLEIEDIQIDDPGPGEVLVKTAASGICHSDLTVITELVPISAADLTLQEKKLTGSYMGSNRFRFDMPTYVDFYLDGRLHLDEMISSRIPLDEVNNAFDRMRKGEEVRQVIIFD